MKNCILILLFLVAQPSYALESEAATALDGGNFEMARTLGRRINTAEGLMIACQAGMLIGGYQQTGDAAIESLHSTINDCHKAVVKDPNHMNARITLAIGVGFEGKRWQKPAYAKLSRTILEQVYADFPGRPAAHAAIGGWHSEVSAAGFLPRLYLRASRSKAKKLFAAAVTIGETDLPFALEYVKLLARGSKADRENAYNVATMYLGTRPRAALDQIMHTNLELVAKAVKSEKKANIKKAIAAATAFNGIEKWRNMPLLDLDFIKQSIPASR